MLKTTWNELPRIHSDNRWYIQKCFSNFKSELWMVFIPYSKENVFQFIKNAWLIHCGFAVKTDKMYENLFKPVNHNLFKLFCKSLCMENFSDLRKQFWVTLPMIYLAKTKLHFKFYRSFNRRTKCTHCKNFEFYLRNFQNV